MAVTPKGEGAEEPSGKSVTFTLVSPAGACGASRKLPSSVMEKTVGRHRDYNDYSFGTTVGYIDIIQFRN